MDDAKTPLTITEEDVGDFSLSVEPGEPAEDADDEAPEQPVTIH